MLQRYSKIVFRCFKSVERAGDALTGFAGPVFVFLAACLLSIGVFSFFNVIAPSISLPILTIPLCLLLATNLVVHYYWACTIAPGFIDDDPTSITTVQNIWTWSKKPSYPGVTWSGARILNLHQRTPTQCRKCARPRPERAHHCSICKRCVLKYDHHWINQCVGLRNERHFFLFLSYLVICSGFYVLLGWSHIREAARFEEKWMHLVPRTLFITIYVLAIALGIAVLIMAAWQLHLISSAETTVENYDNARYTKVARERGGEFINSFDLGRKTNLELFFNIGLSGYSWRTLIIPQRCPPYTDGWIWARRPGMTRHVGINVEDELTDEE